MHIFQRGALLIKLRLQYWVVHQINTSHSSHHRIIWLMRSVVALVVRYTYHLLLSWHGADSSAIISHSTISTSTNTSILIQGVCFVNCCLRPSIHHVLLHLIHTYVANTWMHYLICHILCYYTTLVWSILHLIIWIGCVFWAACTSTWSLTSHMYLILCRGGSLRDHGAICYPIIYHSNLTILIRLNINGLFCSWRLEILLHILILIVQTRLNQRQII